MAYQTLESEGCSDDSVANDINEIFEEWQKASGK